MRASSAAGAGRGAGRGRRGQPLCGDRGSATVWAVIVAGALCLVFGTVLLLEQAVLTRHRAGGAADLAALAAADRALRGKEAACAGAERVAEAHGTEVVRCAVRGEIAEVTVRARSGGFTSEMRARAGPPGAGPSTASDRQGGLGGPGGPGGPENPTKRAPPSGVP